MKRFKKKSYHIYIYKYLKHCSSCYSNEKVITNVVDSFTRGVKPWDQKNKKIPRRDGIQKRRRTMWMRGHTRSIKTNSSNEPISLRSTLGSIYLSIYLPCVDLGGPLRSGPSNAGIHFLSTPLLSLSLFPPPLFSFPLGGRKHGTRKCAHGADT